MPRSNAPQKLLFDAATSTQVDASNGDRATLVGSRKGLKSPIAWYGGKAYYAEWLIDRFPDHRVYVEPFGGAANVLLRKPRSEVEVYNDVDDRVVNLFRVIRDPEQLLYNLWMWIKGCYNRKCLHFSIGYSTQVTFEARRAERHKVALVVA